MKEAAKYWFGLSDYDYTTAGILYKSGIYMYVVFMCHQAIEKALKAYQTEIKDVFPLKIHSLWKLIHVTGLYPILSKEQIAFIGFLEPLNVESRYPSHKKGESHFTPDKENCQKLLHDTAEILERIRKECEVEGQSKSTITEMLEK